MIYSNTHYNKTCVIGHVNMWLTQGKQDLFSVHFNVLVHAFKVVLY